MMVQLSNETNGRLKDASLSFCLDVLERKDAERCATREEIEAVCYLADMTATRFSFSIAEQKRLLGALSSFCLEILERRGFSNLGAQGELAALPKLMNLLFSFFASSADIPLD
jgi:hypothetical protein